MQKIFIRYFLIIMVIMVSFTLLGNFFVQRDLSERSAEERAAVLVQQLRFRLMENAAASQSLVASLNETNVSKARALAEIIAQNPAIIESTMEMCRLAKMLRVDEVHVTDENGILRWGSLPAAYGLDFSLSPQTQPFLPALTNKSFVLSQLPQFNALGVRRFQYAGVARQDKPGIVQVGIMPEVMDNVLENNSIESVIFRYNVQEGVNILALDKKTGIVLGDSKNALVGKHYSELGIGEEYSSNSRTRAWMTVNGEKLYGVSGDARGYRILVTFTQATLFAERERQTIVSAISSTLLGAAIIIAIFVLLKRRILSDVDIVNERLKRITNGDLSVEVDARSTPEFAVLSGGINEMVCALKWQMDELTRQSTVLRQQASRLAQSTRDTLSSLKYARKIQNSLLPAPQFFAKSFADYGILWEPRDMVGGDIYWLRRFQGGTVLCVCDCTGHGTPGALLTMLVVSALNAIVTEENCADPADILWQLEQRLVLTLNVSQGAKGGAYIRDGADLALLFIDPQGGVSVASAQMRLFVCDGKTVESFRGQKLSLGEGRIKSRDQINTIHLPPVPGACYYIVSDGLFEQVGGPSQIPFGYSAFKEIILSRHGQLLQEVVHAVREAFEAYRGGESRRDDVTLVGFLPMHSPQSGAAPGQGVSPHPIKEA